MKPHIYFYLGFWRCAKGPAYGWGVDPKMAYDDWVKDCAHYG